MHSDTIIAILPASTDDERVVVYLLRAASGASTLSLRQQNWAEGIGWYDQRTLDLEPDQFRMLRTLGTAAVNAPRRPADGPATLAFPGTRVESA